MGSYISSNANRFYTGLENSYGRVSEITAQSRIPAVKLRIRQQLEARERKDKTGSRTFTGMPAESRRKTSFELRTYMTTWGDQTADPAYGPLFQGSLGGLPLRFGGGHAAGGSTAGTVAFTGPHGLTAGQALTHQGEIRFVAAILSPTAVQLNAPFSTAPAANDPLGATVTYTPATELPSVSIFDYWSPSTAVQRVVRGGAVNRMEILINADFHEFVFSGVAQEMIDSSSFTGEIGELESFPPEPLSAGFDYSIVPGHMGQAWLGTSPDRFYTITGATVAVDNNLDLRTREFGSNVPHSIAPGRRVVTADFSLLGQDDSASTALFQAARQQSPISVMFQLGEQNGQLVGVWLKSVVPEVPEFDDGQSRLEWKFRGSRAQGTVDDEIALAIG